MSDPNQIYSPETDDGIPYGRILPPLLIVGAISAAIGRIFIAPRLIGTPSIEGTYEALSHLLVGFLIIAPWYDPQQKVGPSQIYGYIGWAIALWELGWFIAQRFI